MIAAATSTGSLVSGLLAACIVPPVWEEEMGSNNRVLRWLDATWRVEAPLR